jgi:hypothetical protein
MLPAWNDSSEANNDSYGLASAILLAVDICTDCTRMHAYVIRNQMRSGVRVDTV